ncbi:RCC1 domain-containing protein [Aspergillus clavatus NRRL 1]|uniref:Alpha-tubulin suppressor protein Aats1, putative n=1 Tax=Aspergillus clavatus (strain ATCC 1007 / CBS 513.65 / DSM 816 / NCTC 3887 / NRRL 1 / QM 1276 / 107) TaxID=344612 RepID=A1C6B7_ASPCL|nr:alpha-tubulin suppressor protein Aats1, putative [Aspergillus clavatus NRRL 1]EAW13938.1 alpha-tubulin suppressor protein Aats1, putative [Aspergillus clavatus NRRL 1]
MPLFAFGSNGSGQLGIGHNEDVSTPTECLFEEQVSSPPEGNRSAAKRISRIVAGGNHTLVLDEDGCVYATGCNEDGRCAHTPAASLQRFRRVIVEDGTGASARSYAAFRDVSATWEASFLVARSEDPSGWVDRVFAAGSGAKGELGLGEGCTRVVEPAAIPDFPPRGTGVVAIASGMGHTVAVLSDGDVWGWGGARKGQLGDAAKAMKIAWSPVKIGGVPFRATGAACGREFTVIAGDKAAGEFVVIGSCDNKWDILSGAASASQSLTAYRGIAASWHGVYVHRSDFSVLAWGRNDRGQIPPTDLPSPQQLAVGSEHVLALVDDHAVVAFGWGEHGNCGPETDPQGNVKGVYREIPLELREDAEVVGIGAGCATSWIITS